MRILWGTTPTRSVLKRFRPEKVFDVNSATNGVWLQGPGQPPTPGYSNAYQHLPTHTTDYHLNVIKRLNAAPSGQVANELQRIRSEILAGTFPLYN